MAIFPILFSAINPEIHWNAGKVPFSVRSDTLDSYFHGFPISWQYMLANRKACWNETQRKKASLRWRHNGHDGVSNHQPHHCLLNRLFGCTSKKTSKLCVTGLCAGNSPGTGDFSAQMANNTENVSIWWRQHDHLPILRPMTYARQWKKSQLLLFGYQRYCQSRANNKENIIAPHWTFFKVNPPITSGSSHKEPGMRKGFPCQNVIMNHDDVSFLSMAVCVDTSVWLRKCLRNQEMWGWIDTCAHINSEYILVMCRVSQGT